MDESTKDKANSSNESKESLPAQTNSSDESKESLPAQIDSSGKAITDRLKEIDALYDAIKKARKKIKKAKDGSLYTLKWWIFICLLALGGSICLGFELYMNFRCPDTTNCPQIEYLDGWGLIFPITIRIVIITAIFSLISFCLRMLRSSLYIYEKYKHKYVVIESLPSLLKSSPEDGEIDVYKKLLGIIVDFGNTGLLSKESDMKNIPELVKYITELLKTLKPENINK